jgi:hypothetical protein
MKNINKLYMKVLNKIFLIVSLTITATMTTYAQDVNKVFENMNAAREAFGNKEYRTAIDKISVVEREIGSTSKPATSYIKIMSYYYLKEYENCTKAVSDYLNGGEVLQDETLTEIRKVEAESQRVLAEREAERQRQLAAQEAERRRQEEAARAKAARDKEAAERWQQLKESSDLSALSAFIDKYGDTPSKDAAQARYNDEKAWNDAKNGYIEDIENYLKGNTLRNHSEEARNRLEYNYERLCKEYAQKGDISNMEDMYSRYVGMFPNGKEKQSMQTTMCKTYFIKGEYLIKGSNTANIKAGMALLEKSKSYSCSNAEDISKLYNRAKRKYKYWEMANKPRFFTGYSCDIKGMDMNFEQRCFIGLTMGGLKAARKGPSVYATVRLNPAFFKSADTYDPDWSERPDMLESWNDAYYTNYTSTGVTMVSNSQFILGLTQQIAYPLYIYAGGGVNLIVNKYEYKKYSGGDFDKIVYYRRKDREILGEKKWILGLFDAGLIVNYKWFYVSSGARTNFTREHTYITIGGGFAF